MSALIVERDPLIPVQRACAALDLPRATLYRHLKPKNEASACEHKTLQCTWAQ